MYVLEVTSPQGCSFQTSGLAYDTEAKGEGEKNVKRKNRKRRKKIRKRKGQKRRG